MKALFKKNLVFSVLFLELIVHHSLTSSHASYEIIKCTLYIIIQSYLVMSIKLIKWKIFIHINVVTNTTEEIFPVGILTKDVLT